MDYFFLFALWFLGTGFHVMQKIITLRKSFPTLSFGVVWSTFFNQEWDSLIVSVLVISVYELVIFIFNYNSFGFYQWFDDWGMYCLALVLGYGGQMLAYKYLNTAVDELNKKVDKMQDKL